MKKKYSFTPIIANHLDGRYENVEFLPAVISLMERYRHFLSDDFYPANKSKRFKAYIELINSLYPHFYAIVCRQDDNNLDCRTTFAMTGESSMISGLSRSDCAFETQEPCPSFNSTTSQASNTQKEPIDVPLESRLAGFVYLSDWKGNEKRVYSCHLTTCFDKKYWGEATLECANEFISMLKRISGLKKIKAQVFEHNFRVKKLLRSVGFEFEGVSKNETIQKGKPVNVVNYGLLLD